MNQPLSGTTATGARTVVITGGNTGLGFACADAILRSPGGTHWHIVLACRDKMRAWEAVDQLASGAGMPGQVEAMSLDLASLPSIRAFTTELGQRLDLGALPPLHAVVCNAGVNPGPTNTPPTASNPASVSIISGTFDSSTTDCLRCRHRLGSSSWPAACMTRHRSPAFRPRRGTIPRPWPTATWGRLRSPIQLSSPGNGATAPPSSPTSTSPTRWLADCQKLSPPTPLIPALCRGPVSCVKHRPRSGLSPSASCPERSRCCVACTHPTCTPRKSPVQRWRGW
jgi:hypothetical protein